MDEKRLKHIASQLRKPEGEDASKTAEWMNRGNAGINLAALHALKPDNGDHILEIGMGNGYFLKELFNQNLDITYTGCDYSKEMTEQATWINERLVKDGCASFVTGEASALPFPESTFHRVLTVNTVYFWEKPEGVLAEIRRVMKPGGRLIIALRPKRQMIQYPFTKYGFSMYSKEDLADLLMKSGFQVTEMIENPEPDFELDGVKMKLEHLLMICNK